MREDPNRPPLCAVLVAGEDLPEFSRMSLAGGIDSVRSRQHDLLPQPNSSGRVGCVIVGLRGRGSETEARTAVSLNLGWQGEFGTRAFEGCREKPC